MHKSKLIGVQKQFQFLNRYIYFFARGVTTLNDMKLKLLLTYLIAS